MTGVIDQKSIINISSLSFKNIYNNYGTVCEIFKQASYSMLSITNCLTASANICSWRCRLTQLFRCSSVWFGQLILERQWSWHHYVWYSLVLFCRGMFIHSQPFYWPKTSGVLYDVFSHTTLEHCSSTSCTKWVIGSHRYSKFNAHLLHHTSRFVFPYRESIIPRTLLIQWWFGFWTAIYPPWKPFGVAC